MERSCLIALYAKGNHGKAYISSLDVTTIGRGTGFFLATEAASYVVTNEHVIRPRLRRLDVPISVLVSLGRGNPAAEDHTHFVPSAREYADDGTGHALRDDKRQPVPQDPLKNVDLALIKLSEHSAERARAEGKSFIRWPEDIAAPTGGQDVSLRGYATEDVDLLVGPKGAPSHLVGDGYTLFSDVTKIEGTRVVIDSREAQVIGCSTPKVNRDLHGISGAGVFDEQKKLVAVVYGGDPKKDEIWACQIENLKPLLEAVAHES